jgi:hypothetical protein
VAVPVAVNFVAETNVVVKDVLPNITWAFFTNLLPVAVMVNAPMGMAVGETVVSTGTGFSRFTAALPVMVASVLLTAVICTESEVGRAGGALYRPVASMVPRVEFPPAMPFTDQRTVFEGLLLAIAPRASDWEAATNTAFEVNPGFEVEVEDDGGLGAGTAAVNCCVAPARTLALDGLMVIPELPVSAHPDRNNAANKSAQQPMVVGKEFLGARCVFVRVMIRIIESLTESCGMSHRANAE